MRKDTRFRKFPAPWSAAAFRVPMSDEAGVERNRSSAGLFEAGVGCNGTNPSATRSHRSRPPRKPFALVQRLTSNCLGGYRYAAHVQSFKPLEWSGGVSDATNIREPAGRSTTVGSGLPVAAFLLGFATAGFLDIVLLHQILQWHHFLSTFGGDLRWQVAVDGWYHAAIFAVAAAGLWRLWRARDDLAEPGAGRTMAAWGLIGLGTCYLIDVLFLHLTLDLHHVRMDVPNPIAWDIGFVAIFGFGSVAAGLWLRRQGHKRPPGGGGNGRPRTARPLAAAFALFVALAGLAALRPGVEAAPTIIAFAPWVEESDAVAASLASGGNLMWTDGAGVVIVKNMPFRHALDLYRAGAIFVGGGALPAACLEWRG